MTQGKTNRYLLQGAFWIGVYLLLTLAPVLLLLIGPTPRAEAFGSSSPWPWASPGSR